MVIFSGGTPLVISKGTPFHKLTLKRNIKQRTPQSTGVTPVLCCRDYHRGKCRHDKDHFGTIRGNKKWLQCICAKCSLERHPEFSSQCLRLRTKTARQSNLLPHHDYRFRIQRISAKFILFNYFSPPYDLYGVCQQSPFEFDVYIACRVPDCVSVSNDTDRDLDFMDSEVLDHLDFVYYRVRDFSVRA